MKIYVFKYSIGEYDDYRERNVKAFKSEEELLLYKNKFDKLVDKLIKESKRVRGIVAQRNYKNMSKYEVKYLYLYYDFSEYNKSFYEEIELI